MSRPKRYTVAILVKVRPDQRAAMSVAASREAQSLAEWARTVLVRESAGLAPAMPHPSDPRQATLFAAPPGVDPEPYRKALSADVGGRKAPAKRGARSKQSAKRKKGTQAKTPRRSPKATRAHS
jgi:hypothetical protein